MLPLVVRPDLSPSRRPSPAPPHKRASRPRAVGAAMTPLASGSRPSGIAELDLGQDIESSIDEFMAEIDAAVGLTP